MSLLSSIGKGIKKALDVNLAVFSAPKTLFTKGVNAAIAETESKTRLQNVGSVLKTGTLAAVGVVTATSTAGKAVLSTVGRALVPKSAGGVAAYAVAAPVAVGVVKGSEKAREAIVNAPSSLSSFGQNVGKVVDNPSIATVKEVFTANPVIAGAVVAGAAGTAALALAPVIASINQTEAIQDQTQAIQQQNATSIPQQIQLIAPPIPTVPTPQAAVAAPTQAAPAARTSKKKKKKPKKKSKKKKKTRRSKKKAKRKSIKRRKKK